MTVKIKNKRRLSLLKVTIYLLLAVLLINTLPTSADASLPFAPRIRSNTRSLPANVEQPSLPKIITTASTTDFHNAYELKMTLEGAIHRITLSKPVYEGLIQSERRDLAVFNADGHIVPFTVREAAPVFRTSMQLFEHPVRFYELPSETQYVSSTAPLDVYVRTDASGHVVSVKSSGKSEERNRYVERHKSYILDFSPVTVYNEAVRRELRLTLPDVRLSAKVSILESSNLRNWKPLLIDVPLLQLKDNETRLSSDNFELPRTPERYVQLRIQDVDPSFELKYVDYFVTVSKQEKLAQKESTSFVDGMLLRDKYNQKSAVEYDTLGAFPISKVNFVLHDPGFYRVGYYSRPDTASEWRMRGRMVLSMIRNHDGSMNSNTAEPISVCEDRFWRIEFEGLFHGVPPKMIISWQPREVYFLAQGKSPYILAFGSPLKVLSLQNDAFLRDNISVVDANIGEAIYTDDTNGKPTPPSVKDSVEDPAEWQRHLVWGLMILGVLMLSGIAVKLLSKSY